MNHSATNTKARMMTATTALLEQQGYHATGLNQIIQASATPKGSLYFHFPGGKEELAIASILAAGEAIGHKIEATLQTSETVGAAIAAFAHLLAQELEDSDFRKGCPVATVAMETAATSDRLRQACEQVYAAWIALVEKQLLAAGFTAGDAQAWTIFIWAAVEGALLLSRTHRSTEPLAIVATKMQQLLTVSTKG
ncbi:MAG: TetR/AcrR family transcriptional regulator [Lyngbya sp. HA4199-MV5]|jgi:TetR/AcrR family transcriptional repressor of lmrAB and yxaGH operons|nr:TetR/AcrR family transcriptional regulator [Lyngbya sp. HA4199-MV5]